MPTSHSSSEKVDDVFTVDLDVANAQLRLNVMRAVFHRGKNVLHGSRYNACPIEIGSIDSLVVGTEHRVRLPSPCLTVDEHRSVEA